MGEAEPPGPGARVARRFRRAEAALLEWPLIGRVRFSPSDPLARVSSLFAPSTQILRAERILRLEGIPKLERIFRLEGPSGNGGQ